MSPRRSSRARNTNPPAATTNSSTSSISSGRAERTTRSNNKFTSPQRSNPRSQSLEDPEDIKPPPRRTRSGHDEIKEVAQQQQDDEIEDEDEEDVTRCVCGQPEYPGLPKPTLDALKQQAKEGGANVSSEIDNDDGSGMFIQCEICKVWQHGGCVGILNDESAPENYFCEECRKDLHEVATTSSGQRYSRYGPTQPDASSTESPAPAGRDSRSRAKEGKPRASAEALAAKRRPTINSYDEYEQLQRAIEESKKEGLRGQEDGARRSKRSRSDSEERKVSAKRQRTGSGSSSPDAEKANIAVSSSDEALALHHRARDDSPKKIRGAAARNQREKEARENQKEKERQEAASRRKARSERRRGDDSDGEAPSPQPVPAPSSTVSTPPALSATSEHQPPSSRSHRKKPGPTSATTPATTNTTVVAQGKAARRVGRSQHSSGLRESLDPNSAEVALGSGVGGNGNLGGGLITGGEAMMRTRSRSRSVARETESPRTLPANAPHSMAADHKSGGTVNGTGSERGGDSNTKPERDAKESRETKDRGGPFGADSRPSRPKYLNITRTSFNEMKKRVAGILEFVNRAQDEGRRVNGRTGKLHSGTAETNWSGNKPGAKDGSSNGGSVEGESGEGDKEKEKGKGKNGGNKDELVKAQAAIMVNGIGAQEIDFGSLGTAEMLNDLKQKLVRWEDEYGRWSRA